MNFILLTHKLHQLGVLIQLSQVQALQGLNLQGAKIGEQLVVGWLVGSQPEGDKCKKSGWWLVGGWPVIGLLDGSQPARVKFERTVGGELDGGWLSVHKPPLRGWIVGPVSDVKLQKL